MKIGQLAATIAKREGHKSQAKIYDIREVLSILSDLSYENADALICIRQLGIARAKRRKKPTT